VVVVEVGAVVEGELALVLVVVVERDSGDVVVEVLGNLAPVPPAMPMTNEGMVIPGV